MTWYALGGAAQLLLAGALLLTRRHHPARQLVEVVPMLALGVATLLGADWALVTGAVFASVWLLDQVLSWRTRDPGRQRDEPARGRPAHVLLGLASVVVAALSWAAVAGAHVAPLG